MEGLRLRVGDIDFSRHTVRVHAGKGGKDRVSVLADYLIEPLNLQITYVRKLHSQDSERGLGEAKLPFALRRKLGHKDVRTTMIYTHVVERGALGAISPLDRL